MTNIAHLPDYPIPEGRQTLSRRDAAFYALSVGLGQDPVAGGCWCAHSAAFAVSSK